MKTLNETLSQTMNEAIADNLSVLCDFYQYIPKLRGTKDYSTSGLEKQHDKSFFDFMNAVTLNSKQISMLNGISNRDERNFIYDLLTKDLATNNLFMDDIKSMYEVCASGIFGKIINFLKANNIQYVAQMGFINKVVYVCDVEISTLTDFQTDLDNKMKSIYKLFDVRFFPFGKRTSIEISF